MNCEASSPAESQCTTVVVPWNNTGEELPATGVGTVSIVGIALLIVALGMLLTRIERNFTEDWD